MRADARVWDVTKAGKKYHAFVDGMSSCKGRYAPKGEPRFTFAEVSAKSTQEAPSYGVCTDCQFRFGFLVREAMEESERFEAAHAEALATNDTTHSANEEDTMSSNHEKIRQGPLTPLQSKILALLAEGKTQAQAAEELSLSRQYVSEHACAAAYKLKAPTTAAAVARFGSFKTYMAAADKIQRVGLIRDPIDPAEEHVNHVVESLAQLLRERAMKLLPE